MQSINGFWLLGFGGAIEVLSDKAEATAKLTVVLPALYDAQRYLESFRDDTALMLPLSKEAAGELLKEVSKLLGAGRDLKEPMGPDAYVITNRIAHLRSVLSAELSNLPMFSLEAQRAYDMRIILWNAHKALSTQAIAALPPRAEFDLDEAGQCIAFECPTAAGFHAMRALEMVARRYSILVTGHDPGADSTFGTLLALLRKEEGARKTAGTFPRSQLSLVINMLDRIRSIYRNPIMHPDMILTNDRAVTVFSTAIDTISVMIDDLRLYSGIFWKWKF
jgi:hypothetical protein